MELKHGTAEEHRATLERAKKNGIDNVWTGDVRRNAYLAENLEWGQEQGLIEVEFEEKYEMQMSFYNIKYLF